MRRNKTYPNIQQSVLHIFVGLLDVANQFLKCPALGRAVLLENILEHYNHMRVGDRRY
jgi:hypothetical protein